MAGNVPTSSREFALAVAFAARVTSGLPTFLGRLDKPFATDTFDPKQGVELKWRQLNGMNQPDDLEELLKAQLPLTKERINASNRRGADVAAAAIDVISALLDNSIDDAQRCTTVAGLALRVAMEMDRSAVRPPGGQRSWAAFELRGQADLFEFVLDAAEGFSLEFIDDLREEAGAESMAYRNGMKDMAAA